MPFPMQIWGSQDLRFNSRLRLDVQGLKSCKKGHRQSQDTQDDSKILRVFLPMSFPGDIFLGPGIPMKRGAFEEGLGFARS